MTTNAAIWRNGKRSWKRAKTLTARRYATRLARISYAAGLRASAARRARFIIIWRPGRVRDIGFQLHMRRLSDAVSPRNKLVRHASGTAGVIT
ncbi:hypothetical protein KCP74_14755 [Salmonella enterica subsp. enterica]|nr:hypothetical protein KCP74_14755 [Salmonella enterica subsp. enterica]